MRALYEDDYRDNDYRDITQREIRNDQDPDCRRRPRYGRHRPHPGHAAPAGAKNVVLVHGGFVDGSGWQGVYDILKKDGYNVTIVQNPTTSLADDVAVTRRATIAEQDGPSSSSAIPMAASSSAKPAPTRR